MHYKTIALELIQQKPELYERLRSSKRLLTAMDAYAIELKASHEAWKEQLSQARPGSDPSQIASEAMELAIQDLRDRLPSGSQATEADPLSLDAAMSFIRRAFAARVRPARGQANLPMFGQPPRRTAAAVDCPAGFLRRFPWLLQPAASAGGLSPATLQPEPPAASGQTAFTKDVFPKGEPSVSPLAAGTGRHDAAGGLEPVSRLFARSERPRLSGPEPAEGNRTMEGTDTTTPPPNSPVARKPRPATSSPPSAHCNRSSGRNVPPPTDERHTLARFGGFGAVALSLFPDPVTGRYKDAG